MRVDGLAPLLGAELQDRAPSTLDTFLEELGQHLLERLAVEVVEENLGHDARPA